MTTRAIIRRRLLSALLVFVAVPALGIALPDPEHCTAPPAVVDGQAMRCPEPQPVVVQPPDDGRPWGVVTHEMRLGQERP